MEIKNSKLGSYFDNKCKCCLSKSHILEDLWGVNLVEGDRGVYVHVYGEMIAKCFSISWQKPVDCTELICGPCIKSLIIAFKFKRDVLASEQILLEKLKDDDIISNEIIEEDMMDDNDIEEDLTSDEEPENKALSDNSQHIEETVIEVNMEEMEYCEVVYLDQNINIESLKKEKDQTNLPQRPKNTNVNEIGTVKDLENCLRATKVPKYPSLCGMCGQEFLESSSLPQHKCTRASNSSSCDTQEQGQQIEKKFTCDICKKDFKLKRSLIRHILEVHKFGTKIKLLLFTCDICSMRFPKRYALLMHKRVHSGEKPFSCKICSMQFSRRSNLVLHQRVHSGEKPYSCKICNKQFAQSSTLNTHQRVHTGDKPHTCEICSKQFSQRAYLIVHKRIHTGEKPFSCNICNLKFSMGSNLNRHQRVHSGRRLKRVQRVHSSSGSTC